MRIFPGIGLCALGLLRGLSCGAATAPTALATTGQDANYANFAFASEVGSGVYEINGSTIQVYRLPFSYRLRDAPRPRGRPGIRLILPATVGFANFQLRDLAHLEIPTNISALSLEPGVEFDYWLHEDWHVYPYIRGGATFATRACTTTAPRRTARRCRMTHSPGCATGWNCDTAWGSLTGSGALRSACTGSVTCIWTRPMDRPRVSARARCSLRAVLCSV